MCFFSVASLFAASKNSAISSAFCISVPSTTAHESRPGENMDIGASAWKGDDPEERKPLPLQLKSIGRPIDDCRVKCCGLWRIGGKPTEIGRGAHLYTAFAFEFALDGDDTEEETAEEGKGEGEEEENVEGEEEEEEAGKDGIEDVVPMG